MTLSTSQFPKKKRVNLLDMMVSNAMTRRVMYSLLMILIGSWCPVSRSEIAQMNCYDCEVKCTTRREVPCFPGITKCITMILPDYDGITKRCYFPHAESICATINKGNATKSVGRNKCLICDQNLCNDGISKMTRQTDISSTPRYLLVILPILFMFS